MERHEHTRCGRSTDVRSRHDSSWRIYHCYSQGEVQKESVLMGQAIWLHLAEQKVQSDRMARRSQRRKLLG